MKTRKGKWDVATSDEDRLSRTDSAAIDVKGITIDGVGVDEIDFGLISLKSSSIGEIGCKSIRGEVAYNGTLQGAKVKIVLDLGGGIEKERMPKNSPEKEAEEEIKHEGQLNRQQINIIRTVFRNYFESEIVKPMKRINETITISIGDIPLNNLKVPLNWDHLKFGKIPFSADTEVTIPGFRQKATASDIHIPYESESSLSSIQRVTASKLKFSPNLSSDLSLGMIAQGFKIDLIRIPQIVIDDHVGPQEHGKLDWVPVNWSKRYDIARLSIPFYGTVVAYVELGFAIRIEIDNWHTQSIDIKAVFDEMYIKDIQINLRIDNPVLRGVGFDAINIDQLVVDSGK